MSMLAETLLKLMRRDLGALRREVEAYPDEESVWAGVPGLPNSGGVLVRHLAGNLQHYIGAILGGSGYLRRRDEEFNGVPWSKARLIAEIDATSTIVTRVLPSLTPELLARPYPERLFQLELETAEFLSHLAVHLGFHLGQVDYHRRSVTGLSASIGPMSIPESFSPRGPVS